MPQVESILQLKTLNVENNLQLKRFSMFQQLSVKTNLYVKLILQLK